MNRRAFFKRAGTMGVGLAGAALIGTAVDDGSASALTADHVREAADHIRGMNGLTSTSGGTWYGTSTQANPEIEHPAEVYRKAADRAYMEAIDRQIVEFNSTPRYLDGNRLSIEWGTA